jgi:hypothetical protein
LIRPLVALLLAGTLVSACSGTTLPTRQNPSCSWDSAVPGNAATVCSAVYRTLSSVARAEETGNRAVMNRLIVNAGVRHRIMAHGRALRAQRVRNLHVVPSITLDHIHRKTFGAGFYLNGNIQGGRVNAPQTIELRVEGKRAVIINDQPGQEW